MIERTNVGHSDFLPEQIVEVDVHLGRRIDGDVHILIADHVTRDDRATNRGTAVAAIDVDPHAAGSGGVVGVGQVSSYEIANDVVSVHVVRRCAKSGADVGVQTDAA